MKRIYYVKLNKSYLVIDNSLPPKHSGPNPRGRWTWTTKDKATPLDLESANYWLRTMENCYGKWKNQFEGIPICKIVMDKSLIKSEDERLAREVRLQSKKPRVRLRKKG